MAKHDHDFSWQLCHNQECEMYMKKGEGNIKVHAHGGQNKDIHELKCTCCGKLFSENKGTPYYDMRTPKDTIHNVLKLLAEGNGIRKTERIIGIHRDTVTKILERSAAHLEKVNNEFLSGLKTGEIQFDELWTFVKKREPPSVKSTTKI